MGSHKEIFSEEMAKSDSGVELDKCRIVRYKGNILSKTIGFNDWIGMIKESKKEDGSELCSFHEYRCFFYGLR